MGNKTRLNEPHNRSCDELHQNLAWKGCPWWINFGLRHKDICPFIKQWRLVKRGRKEKTPELRLEMLQFLRKSLEVAPRTVAEGGDVAWSEEFRRYVQDYDG